MSNYKSRRRRSRYTVTFNQGQDAKVVLAYSVDEVWIYFESRGYDVNSVEKGDYRKFERQAENKADGPQWTIDQKVLKTVIESMGIKREVKIRKHARQGSTNGNYRYRGGYHDIMLKSYRTADQANATLWHELKHAQQAERAVAEGRDWYAVTREQKRYSYKQRPIEVEARLWSEQNKNIKIVVPA